MQLLNSNGCICSGHSDPANGQAFLSNGFDLIMKMFLTEHALYILFLFEYQYCTIQR